MGTKEKLLQRFGRLPKDFSFSETVSMLRYLGYEIHNKGATSGSRIRFLNKGTGAFIDLHKPHPDGIRKGWMVKAIYVHLKNRGLI